MTSLLTLEDRNVFLKYCTDPIYLEILNAYFDFLEASELQNTKAFYDFQYSNSSLDPYTRLKILNNKNSLLSIKKIAEDFGVTIEYNQKQPFILGESALNSNDFLSDSYFDKNIFTITSYNNHEKMVAFVEYFHEHLKVAGILTDLYVN